MSYLTDMSSAELAHQYAIYRNDDALRELEYRDRLAGMTFDEQIKLALNESDSQIFFAFAKEEKMQNNKVDEWQEAYESGYSAGEKAREKLICRALDLAMRNTEDETVSRSSKHNPEDGCSQA